MPDIYPVIYPEADEQPWERYVREHKLLSGRKKKKPKPRLCQMLGVKTNEPFHVADLCDGQNFCVVEEDGTFIAKTKDGRVSPETTNSILLFAIENPNAVRRIRGREIPFEAKRKEAEEAVEAAKKLHEFCMRRDPFCGDCWFRKFNEDGNSYCGLVGWEDKGTRIPCDWDYALLL